MTNEPIAVMAGTPVDTQMGMDCLQKVGLHSAAYPISADPHIQTRFQLSSPQEKIPVVRGVLEQAKAQGCHSVFVYCNSLSGAVDFRPLAKETGLFIVTPLDVYRELAGSYAVLGAMAANAQGMAGIERTLLAANPDLRLYGSSCLDAVLAVEAQEPPDALVERLGLATLAAWFEHCGAEAFVLGCTHFPYFKEALARRVGLPLYDPAERMISMLMQNIEA